VCTEKEALRSMESVIVLAMLDTYPSVTPTIDTTPTLDTTPELYITITEILCKKPLTYETLEDRF
jgi:hypothetical protein